MTFLKEVLEEIENRTDYPFRLIVVDNGSTDGTREWIKEYNESGRIWKYKFTDKNLFLSDAYAEGLKLVESEFFIVTQDDIIPPGVKDPCWLTRLVKEINEHPEFASISLHAGRRHFHKYLRSKYAKRS